uniref:Calcium channel, voltage-dependent, alpha 2/delta subunit 4a n=1 Tax=Sinocyclocheilus rhinocerous TaxID=307959 RepID=A0A673H843_9TELE
MIIIFSFILKTKTTMHVKYKEVEPIVKMQEVDGLKMVKEFAEEMENMLGRKMKSVKRMAETVEDADFYHEYNATLEFDYYNSMMINTLDEDGNNADVIQVPTNVYNKDPDILNGVFMSEALNDIFTSNFEKDPTLTWQYFGSSTEFFRLYPGIKWTPDENGVVTFDARNRYYTHISTLADVQENVMEYLHVLSRPMVINQDHDIIWTEAYMDSVLFNTQAESLLLMTSVAMPVFSKKEETRFYGILLGVVGTDVSLKDFISWLLDTRYGKKLKPKPNYNSVDLSEMEWEDTEDLRTAMVKVESGTLSLDVRATVEKGCDSSGLTLCVFVISLGIVLIKGHGKNVFIGNVSVEEGLHDLTAFDVTIANEWTYCETDIDPHHRKLTQFQAVIRYLTGKEPDLECDERLLQHTLFDAVVTAPMEAYWTALLLNASGLRSWARSGLMRMIRYVGVEKRVAKKFLSPSDKENIFTLDHFPVWYRRAAENPAGRFLYYIPIEDSTQGSLHPAVHIIQTRRLYTLLRASCSVFFFFPCMLLYDYQAMCKVNPHSASGARPLQSVSIVLSICFVASKKSKGDILQPCDTEYPSFVYEPSIKETNSMIKCGRCQKVFVINQIPDSNLLLVVIHADCDSHNASVKCDRMRSQKIRRRPESCHAYHPQENAKDCGGAAAISLSIMLFLACLSVSALIRR